MARRRSTGRRPSNFSSSSPTHSRRWSDDKRTEPTEECMSLARNSSVEPEVEGVIAPADPDPTTEKLGDAQFFYITIRLAADGGCSEVPRLFTSERWLSAL